MPGKSKREQFAHRLNARLRKAKIKRECLHPNAPHDCRGKIVRAHTVQRKLLKLIARKGKVYTLDFDMTLDESPLTMALKGVSQASTFTGYCSLHDNQLFAPIEDHDLKLDQHHAALLTYRSLSMELFNKRRVSDLNASELGIDSPDNEFSNRLKAIHDLQKPGTDLAIRDADILVPMGQDILDDNFTDFYYYAIQLDSLPEVVCSAGRTLACDIDGNPVQDHASPSPLDLIAINVLPHRNRYGVALFSWYGQSDPNERFIESLDAKSDAEKPNLLVGIMFHNVENIFAAPRWWDGLPPDQKASLLRKFEYSGSWSTPVNFPITYDSTQYVNWTVAGIETNLSL